jgi:serine O-acetyltransferase
MKKTLKIILTIVSSIRLIPHWIIYNTHKKNYLLKEDVKQWLKSRKAENFGNQFGFLYLMTFYHEYRNVFYCRIGLIKYILKYLCLPMNSLLLGLEFGGDIGSGIIIWHGQSTIIFAKSIGKNCMVWQQVTVGRGGKDGGTPVIGDNVKIFSGAKVLGSIKIGNNVQIGANAVVVKDVPDNCTAAGVPAHIIRKDGIKIKESL